jgi:hypothetical protein
VKLTDQGDIQAGFLLGLAHSGLLKALAVINKTAGQSPAMRRILPLNQDNALFQLNDDVNGGDWVSVRRHESLPLFLQRLKTVASHQNKSVPFFFAYFE